MRKVTSFRYSQAWVFALVLSSIGYAGDPNNRSVILSTTTSTQDSGLLDVLAPLFEKQSGYAVKTISIWSRTRRKSARVSCSVPLK